MKVHAVAYVADLRDSSTSQNLPQNNPTDSLLMDNYYFQLTSFLDDKYFRTCDLLNSGPFTSHPATSDISLAKIGLNLDDSFAVTLSSTLQSGAFQRSCRTVNGITNCRVSAIFSLQCYSNVNNNALYNTAEIATKGKL